MCNLYRMDDKDWVRKWAVDAESLINPMPAYQVNPDQMAPIIRNTTDGHQQLVHARWGLPAPFYVLRKPPRREPRSFGRRAKRSTWISS